MHVAHCMCICSRPHAGPIHMDTALLSLTGKYQWLCVTIPAGTQEDSVNFAGGSRCRSNERKAERVWETAGGCMQDR